MTHPIISSGSFAKNDLHLKASCIIHHRFMCVIMISYMTHPIHMRHDTCIRVTAACCCWAHIMGWLRLVGSWKLQVSFAKEPYKSDYILQKRLTILKSLLIVDIPYHSWPIHVCRNDFIYLCEQWRHPVAVCCSVLQCVAVCCSVVECMLSYSWLILVLLLSLWYHVR